MSDATPTPNTPQTGPVKPSNATVEKPQRKPFTDLVRQNGVLEEQIEQEELTRKKYDVKWGYMKNFNAICLEIAERRGIKEIYVKHNRFKREPKIKSSSNWNLPESGPFPITTLGEVGWRSSKPECNLERLGRLYVSPRYTLNPPGVEPEPPVASIILG